MALIAAADEGNIALDAKFSASICIADDRIIDMLVKNALTNLECLLSEANVYLQLFELEQQEALKTATVGGDPEIATLTQLIVSGPTSDDIILVEPRYDSRMMRINPMPRLFRKYEIPHYDSLKWKHFCFWHEFDETMKCVEYERRRNKKLKARYYLMSSVRARNSWTRLCPGFKIFKTIKGIFKNQRCQAMKGLTLRGKYRRGIGGSPLFSPYHITSGMLIIDGEDSGDDHRKKKVKCLDCDLAEVLKL